MWTMCTLKAQHACVSSLRTWFFDWITQIIVILRIISSNNIVKLSKTMLCFWSVCISGPYVHRCESLSYSTDLTVFNHFLYFFMYLYLYIGLFVLIRQFESASITDYLFQFYLGKWMTYPFHTVFLSISIRQLFFFATSHG